MSAKISSENEQFISEAVAAGRFATREEILNEGVRLLRQEVEVNGLKDSASTETVEEWVADLEAWAAAHRPVADLVDDSRESIYAGRGE